MRTSPLNQHLTANNQSFRYGYQDGKYGYITREGGADTFNPFSSGFDWVIYMYYYTTNGGYWGNCKYTVIYADGTTEEYVVADNMRGSINIPNIASGIYYNNYNNVNFTPLVDMYRIQANTTGDTSHGYPPNITLVPKNVQTNMSAATYASQILIPKK